jgi:hypothetical protein
MLGRHKRVHGTDFWRGQQVLCAPVHAYATMPAL